MCYFCSHLRSFDQSDHNYNYLFIFRNVIEGKKFDEELTVSHEFFKKLEKTARQITRKFKTCFIRTNQEQLRKHISNKYFNCIEQILNIIVNYGKVNLTSWMYWEYWTRTLEIKYMLVLPRFIFSIYFYLSFYSSQS